MSKIVVILGANGALGRAVSAKFASNSWKTILFDVNVQDSVSSDVLKLPADRNAKDQFSFVKNTVSESIGNGKKVNAIINVGGGFRLDTAESEDGFETLQAMYSSSVESSMIAAHLAAKYLSVNGLLVLPGAAAAGSGTPWAISYGAMKAAVHHLIKSLSNNGSGLPEKSSVVGVAPVMLDTPMNRSSMPDADFSSWTKTDVVAEQIFSWTEILPASGCVFKVQTAGNVTEFIPM